MNFNEFEKNVTMMKQELARKLVECSKCPCDKFELELDENNLLVE